MDAGDASGAINAAAARARRAPEFSLDGSGVKPYWSAYQSRGVTRSKWGHSNSKNCKFKNSVVEPILSTATKRAGYADAGDFDILRRELGASGDAHHARAKQFREPDRPE